MRRKIKMLMTTLHMILVEFFNNTRYNMGSPLYIKYWDTIHTTMDIKDVSICIELHRKQSEQPIREYDNEGHLEIEIKKIDKNPYHTLFFSVQTPEYANSGCYALKFNNIDIYGFSIEYTEDGELLSDKAKIFFDDMIRFIYEKAGIKIPEPKTEKKKPGRKKKALSAEPIDLDTMFKSHYTAQEARDAVQSFDPWAGINTTPAHPNLASPCDPFANYPGIRSPLYSESPAQTDQFSIYRQIADQFVNNQLDTVDRLFINTFAQYGFHQPQDIARALIHYPVVVARVIDDINRMLPMYGFTGLIITKTVDLTRILCLPSATPEDDLVKKIEERFECLRGKQADS